MKTFPHSIGVKSLHRIIAGFVPLVLVPSAFAAISTLDGGGQRTTSANYTMDGSVGGIGGISTAGGPSTFLKNGFVGQLVEVTNVAVAATPSSVGSGSNSQLSASARLDDGTLQAVGDKEVAWEVPAFPIDSISAGGVATASAVTTNAAGTFRGVALGQQGQGTLLVRVGTCAPDSWKEQYFGENYRDDPRSREDADPTGSGMPNWKKYLAGLDPLDRHDRFEPSQHGFEVGTSNAVYTLQWKSKPAKIYQVQYSGDLKGWNAAGTNITAFATTTSWTDDGSQTGSPPHQQTKRFYRVKIVP